MTAKSQNKHLVEIELSFFLQATEHLRDFRVNLLLFCVDFVGTWEEAPGQSRRITSSKHSGPSLEDVAKETNIWAA